MQNVVVDTIIAALLALTLWCLDRGRGDRRLRLWLLAWSLVPLYCASLAWNPASATAHSLQRAEVALLPLLTAVLFLLSDPVVLRTRRNLWQSAALGTVPALLCGFAILFQPSNRGPLYAAVVLAHALAIIFARQHVGRSAVKFFPLAGLHFVSACWMLGALASHQNDVVLASIPAEMFLLNALLFSRNYGMRSVGSVLTVGGFVLWALSSFAAVALRQGGTSALLLTQGLNLPAFITGAGLILLVLRQDGIAMREMKLELGLLFNNNPLPAWIYDLKTLRVLSANSASAKAQGYSVEQLCQQRLTDIIHPDTDATVLEEILSPSARPSRYSIQLRRDGSKLPVNITVFDVRFNGRPARIALGEDVSEREQMASQLMYQVEHDLLTGLPNRDAFLRKLDEVFISSSCDGMGCAVIAFQINRFEKVNEKYGHHVGDLLLQRSAQLLQSKLADGDVIGRTGSREFTMALAHIPHAMAAQTKAQELLRLFDTAVVAGGHAITVSSSMGMAAFPEDSDDAMALLRDAAHACTLARAQAPDNFVRLSRALSMEAQEESRIEALIQQALSEGGFEVLYQPIADTSGELCGMEALLRLYDMDGTMVSPNVFIPIAEASETIIRLGRWVIEDVCRQLSEWTAAGLKVVPVAINASALQIVQPTFSADVLSTLEKYGIDPSLVHVEVTESSVMPRGSLALDNMMELSSRGIHFSIDDFGTGFSSLNRLHQLPVSILKIDRSFVSRMTDADGTMPIVSTIISMAHSLKVGVIAEGVETTEQFHSLYEMGCDQFQGYFFSRPLHVESVTNLLARTPQTLMLSRSVGAEMVSSPVIAFPAQQLAGRRR